MTNLVITRKPGWHAPLIEYLAGVQRRQLQYGQHDCALFVSDAVAAMTGVDLGGEFRGSYASAEEGLKTLLRRGYRDHVAFVAAHFEEIPPSFARAGDIAVLDAPDLPALGVFQGASIYVLKPRTLGTVSRSLAVRAFKVT